MRRLPLAAAAAAVLLPTAALGQDGEGEAGRLAEELRDPARQEQMAAMIEAMAGVLLEVPVAPLMRAAADVAGENPENIDPDATVGDIVGPEALDAPRELADRLPRMMGAMAGMTDALEDMLPRLREAMEQAGREYRRAE